MPEPDQPEPEPDPRKHALSCCYEPATKPHKSQGQVRTQERQGESHRESCMEGGDPQLPSASPSDGAAAVDFDGLFEQLQSSDYFFLEVALRSPNSRASPPPAAFISADVAIAATAATTPAANASWCVQTGSASPSSVDLGLLEESLPGDTAWYEVASPSPNSLQAYPPPAVYFSADATLNPTATTPAANASWWIQTGGSSPASHRERFSQALPYIRERQRDGDVLVQLWVLVRQFVQLERQVAQLNRQLVQLERRLSVFVMRFSWLCREVELLLRGGEPGWLLEPPLKPATWVRAPPLASGGPSDGPSDGLSNEKKKVELLCELNMRKFIGALQNKLQKLTSELTMTCKLTSELTMTFNLTSELITSQKLTFELIMIGQLNTICSDFQAINLMSTEVSSNIEFSRALHEDALPELSIMIRQLSNIYSTAINLRSTEVSSIPRIKFSSGFYKDALPEILEVLRAACFTHKLPLAQTWVACFQQRKRSSRHSDENYRYCISTNDEACYVNEAQMQGFHEACSEHHLLRGQGVAGKAFTTNQPCFLPDIGCSTKLDYPLSHHAKIFNLKGAVAIRLRCTRTGNTDFVLEFFLPTDCVALEEQKALRDSLSGTMRSVCQTLRVVTDEEMEEEAMLEMNELNSFTPPWKNKVEESSFGDKSTDCRGEASWTSLAETSQQEPGLASFGGQVPSLAGVQTTAEGSKAKARTEVEKTVSLEDLQQNMEVCVDKDTEQENEIFGTMSQEDEQEEEVAGEASSQQQQQRVIAKAGGQRQQGKRPRSVASTSLNPPKSRRSKVWKHFKEVSPEGEAECLHCHQKLKAHSKTDGTSSLWRHVKSHRRNGTEVSNGFSKSEKNNDGPIALRNCENDVAIVRTAIFVFLLGDSHPSTVPGEHGFNNMISLACPQLKDVKRDSIRRDVAAIFDRERKDVIEALTSSPGRVSFTLDNWKSDCQKYNYICITGHYIDAHWKLHKRIIWFKKLNPPLDGASMADKVAMCFREAKVDSKIMCMTLDNASHNDSMISTLKTHLAPKCVLPVWGTFFQVHCWAHILNLIAQAGLKLIDTSVDKLRDGIQYIKASSNRMHKFYDAAVNIFQLDAKRKLHMDMPVHWNSTYKMVDTVLYFQAVLEHFSKMDSIFKLNFWPSPEEWNELDAMKRFLKKFYDATCIFSGTKYPTSNLYFRSVFMVHSSLIEALKESENFMTPMVKQMKAMFDKYWDDHRTILSCAAILDPRYKLQFLSYCYSKLYGDGARHHIDEVRQTMQTLFDEGYRGSIIYSHPDGDTPNNTSDVNGVVDMFSDYGQFLSSWQTNEGMSQLDLYLAEPCKDINENLDVLDYWSKKSAHYPELGLMARDVLAIPVSSVTLESAFTTKRKVMTHNQSSLSSKTIEALMCLEDWYRERMDEASAASTQDAAETTTGVGDEEASDSE